jgi:hypothetical protein
MADIIFWLSFGCSFNHVFLTLFPFDQFLDQFLDQLRIHNYNPIDILSMIYFGDHHGIFIAKILHLILLVNNRQNGNNSIGIF